MDYWQLYGVKGWGSAIAECALSWAGVRYCFHNVEGFDAPGTARDRLALVNPLLRVPALVSPEKDVLTESGAIMLELGARYPDTHLVPERGSGSQPAFFNRLLWFNSVLYPTFSYRDYPERWAPSAADELVRTIDTFRRSLWSRFEVEVRGRQWVLGDRPSGLDIYLAVMSHWRPGRGWLKEHCPRLHAVALRTDELPAIRDVLADNFPQSDT